MTQLIALAAFVAVFFVLCIGESIIRKRRPIDDLRHSCAYHNSAQDKHMRILRNLRTPRSTSSIKGGL